MKEYTVKKISVITVSFNAAATIETAIKSVQTQICPDIEHIIIDGGSIDQTAKIIERHRKGIAYYISEPDTGIYNAMNKGIRAATGDILFFLNADDRFSDPEVVKDVVSVFQKYPDLEIVYGELTWERPDKNLNSSQPSLINREFLASRTILHQTVFARAAVFEATQGFSEHYKVVSDYEWMLKVFLRDKRRYLYIDRKIAVMNTQGRSWTTKWENERIRVMMHYFSPYEIWKYRIRPRQKPIIRNYLNAKKVSFKKVINRISNGIVNIKI
jgi:glycosyltransferase